MNVSKLLLKFVSTAGPSIKSWVFADGKFKKSRAIILIVAFILIGVSIQFLGADQTAVVIDILDDFSDILGYAE